MIRKLNRKGFTLVELLAVLVILIAIMAIAIPTISSSLERTKVKQDRSRIKVIESAAELYVSDHKNDIYTTLGSGDECFIKISDIDYLTSEEMEDSDGNSLGEHYVKFTRPNEYEYVKDVSGLIECATGHQAPSVEEPEQEPSTEEPEIDGGTVFLKKDDTQDGYYISGYSVISESEFNVYPEKSKWDDLLDKVENNPDWFKSRAFCLDNTSGNYRHAAVTNCSEICKISKVYGYKNNSIIFDC